MHSVITAPLKRTKYSAHKTQRYTIKNDSYTPWSVNNSELVSPSNSIVNPRDVFNLSRHEDEMKRELRDSDFNTKAFSCRPSIKSKWASLKANASNSAAKTIQPNQSPVKELNIDLQNMLIKAPIQSKR